MAPKRAHEVEGGRATMTGPFLDRYLAGDACGVWTDLLTLGPAVRSSSYAEDAHAVARETMVRVRRNLDVIHARLLQLGYRFHEPDAAVVPPPAATGTLLEEIEHLLGPLPLSLRVFYEVVGSVDLRQSIDQITRKAWPERAREPELSRLGDYDPMQVFPIQDLHKQACRRQTVAGNTPPRLYFCWAADEYHKAHYSGGENYHVWLPDPAADFRIEGMYDIDEYFVGYLRASFVSGGFRGSVEPLPDDNERCRKVAPPLQIIQALAADLLPISLSRLRVHWTAATVPDVACYCPCPIHQTRPSVEIAAAPEHFVPPLLLRRCRAEFFRVGRAHGLQFHRHLFCLIGTHVARANAATRLTA
jgi:hypothetical protein